MRRQGLLWLFLLLPCLFFAGPALGESTYSFDSEGIRLYIPEDWQALTLANLSGRETQIAALGTTQEALKASFLADGTLLEAFPPEGGQVFVKSKPLPEGTGTQDAYAMTAQQREAFLLAVARAGGFAHGAWSDVLPEFAVFRGSASLQALSVNTVTYATARYGQMYLVSMNVIGRDVSAADEAALLKAASSLLFLGARLTAAPETTPMPRAALDPNPTPTPVPAEIRVARNDTYLELDYAPSTSSVSKLTLTGTTEPNTPLRYYVNNKGYERFTADGEGRFTIYVRTLAKGKNVVAVHAIGENGYGVVNFTVVLDQARSPLAVTEFPKGIAGASAVITGSVLPGSTVKVMQKSKTYTAQVAEDGGFACEIPLNKLGENAFTVRAETPGYLRSDESVVISRVLSDADQQAAFLKKVKTVAYDKLMDKPTKYAGYAVRFKGRVLSLSGSLGQPLAVVETESGVVAVSCQDLGGLEINKEIDALCELTGVLRTVSLGGETRSVPEADLRWLLSNGQ